jgi:beta-lactamase superfamily II metal-dependent hydrolase
MKKITLFALFNPFSFGVLFWNGRPDGLLHVYFLNVGQGDAIFIRTPSGVQILVDGGKDKKTVEELKSVVPFFDPTIDYLIMSHPDADHMGGFIQVLQKYPVKRVILSNLNKDNYFMKTFLTEILDRKIPITIADKNTDFALKDGVSLDTLYPFSSMFNFQGDTNETSIVMKVIYGANEILLTGDAEFPVEEKLLAAGANVDSDILKVGHHGSKNGSSAAFLEKVSPEYAVISVSKDNNYGHPTKDALTRLYDAHAKILRTDLDGRIEFTFDKKGILVP